MAVKLQSESGSRVFFADRGEKIVLKFSFGKFSDQINETYYLNATLLRVEICGFVALVTALDDLRFH